MKKLIALTLTLTMMLCTVPPALADQQLFASQTLLTWSSYYKHYVQTLADSLPEGTVVDTPLPSGIIGYDENSFSYGPYTDVSVIHGGSYSPNNTITLGMGTGLDENENYWYVSITYSPERNSDTLFATATAFALASIKVGLPLGGSDFDGLLEFLDVLMSYDDIALQMGDYVLVHKALNGGQELLALDTLAYYNEFYYNDTENYVVLE